MDWDKLHYFLMVARHGTLARAAAALHVDATTVSRQVSALEAALQQTLFERAPTGFVLTAAGRALVPHAEAMAAAAARIHKADDGGSALSGQLRVSVSEGFGNSFIAPRLAGFVAAHPARDRPGRVVGFPQPVAARRPIWRCCSRGRAKAR